MDHRSDSSCSSSSSSQTQTALPSIRQLDLHLPPPWAPPPAYSSSSSTQPPTQQQQHQQQHLPTLRESRSSEPEGEDSHSHTEEGPPKKRRRRQALSCTECKRRKIKCDRSQPCTPCARRGETDKCQWHASEPPNPSTTPSQDQFVSRAEHEALKRRVDHLEQFLQQAMHPHHSPQADKLAISEQHYPIKLEQSPSLSQRHTHNHHDRATSPYARSYTDHSRSKNSRAQTPNILVRLGERLRLNSFRGLGQQDQEVQQRERYYPPPSHHHSSPRMVTVQAE